jgi:hypothetical protein
MFAMPRAHPPEFRQRAVELARLREKPIPAGIDLRELEDRASKQRARVHPHHVRAARAALAS